MRISAAPSKERPQSAPAGARRPPARLAACAEVSRDTCERFLAGLLLGARSDRLALRRAARQHCAIFQCLEERGLGSCAQCPEAPCIFHEHFARICPAGADPAPEPTWRLRPGAAQARGDFSARPRGPAPERTIARLRWYVLALEHFREAGIKVVSSADLGGRVGVRSSLVRRDLCHFGQFGTPSLGYPVEELHAALQSLFHLDDRRVVWVGIERLLSEPGISVQFAKHGWRIAAAFDPDPAQVGRKVDRLTVMPLAELPRVVAELGISAAVLAVSEERSQKVAEQVVAAGVEALLNLSAAPLALPPQVVVQQADLATQLLLLAYHVRMARENQDRE